MLQGGLLACASALLLGVYSCVVCMHFHALCLHVSFSVYIMFPSLHVFVNWWVL